MVSVANGVAGVFNTAVLSVHVIGRAYAELAPTLPRSGWHRANVVLRSWTRFVIGTHPSVIIAMDRTDFEADDHTTLCVYLVATHGRAMPLAWRTVKKSKLKDRQRALEVRDG